MKKDLNVVIIISDTFRRDCLDCYGNKSVMTPHISKFAKSCRIFDRAYVASFPTMPMRADLFTGKYTMTYLGWAPLPKDEVILSQTLADKGYLTAAVVDTPFSVSRGFHYDRGFHDFITVRGQGVGVNVWQNYGMIERTDINYERRYEEDYCAPMVSRKAEHWLERHYKDKFFLYVDMWDPHEPWDPPAHYVKQYYPKWKGEIINPHYYYWNKGNDKKKEGFKRKEIEIARACYAGEVTMVDRAVGRIIERLQSLNILDKTLILFTADHGFHLGEHGLFGKVIWANRKLMGSPLYDEVARVPLLVFLPGSKPGRTNAIVQPPDLMPTLLDILGIDIPTTVQGKSMADILKTGTGRGLDFAVSSLPLYNPGQESKVVDDWTRIVDDYLEATVNSGPWTLFYKRSGYPVELYDTKDDPKQTRNVAKNHPDVIQRLHKKYFNLIKKCGASESCLRQEHLYDS